MSTTASGSSSSGKLAFSLKSKKKRPVVTVPAADRKGLGFGFDTHEDDEPVDGDINTDLPKAPLVIPVQQDARQSLQEQAKQRREQQEKSNETTKTATETTTANTNTNTNTNEEDQAAIEALQAEAGGERNTETLDASKMVIAKTENTFQAQTTTAATSSTSTSTTGTNKQKKKKVEQEGMEDTQQLFQDDLDQLAPEVSVDSQVYREVPIADFGAAMLRGMGWTGTVDTSDATAQSLPRPSRLGLGATPKLLEAPTHSGTTRRRPRRQDQVQRERKLKEQHQQYEQQRQQQIKLDKQRTIQVGSLVQVVENEPSSSSLPSNTIKSTPTPNRRAIIRQWQGVPGLNMILIQYEHEHERGRASSEATKVKKGSVQLIDRLDLQTNPFQEPEYQRPNVEYLGETQKRDERTRQNDDKGRDEEDHDHDRPRRRDEDGDDRRRRSDNDDDDDRRRSHRNDDRRRRDDNTKDDDPRRRSRRRGGEEDRERDSDRRKRRRDEDQDKDRKRHRRGEEEQQRPSSTTWLIPSIRVRIVTSKLGKQYYKEKGVVVDVTTKGTATLNMANHAGQVLQVPERYLETALPKVGGNACILTGKHRLAKGRLLERDSKANRGAIQVFEDMNIVNTSLDDIAEWCGPLDDDLME
jgi:hypothetical protein